MQTNNKFYYIKGFEKYMINEYGVVLSLHYNKILKPKLNIDGYNVVTLYKDSKRYYFFVHRLVGDVLCEKEIKHTQINHKDGNKLNNHYSNLEWCTCSENIKHAYRVLNKKPVNLGKKGVLNHNSKKINQYDLKGNFIKTWDSMMDIQREFGINTGDIHKCCNKGVTYKKFKWGYK